MNNKHDRMTIKILAEKANLTPRSIRYYEQLGILTGIKRDPYNRRRYTKDDLYFLRLVKRARDILGLSLKEIKALAFFHYKEPTEKKMIKHSIKLLNEQVKKTERQKKEVQITKEILIKEINRLETLINT